MENETLELFAADEELKAAIGADIDAGGGDKVVGVLLWADKNPDTAQRLASNAANPKQKQKLTYEQTQLLKSIARAAVGKSQVHALESKRLKAKLHWVTLEEEAQEATLTLVGAMQGMHAAIRQANDLMKKLSEFAK